MQNNIKSGFNATGIHPFNKQKVIIKVPTRSEDDNNEIDLLEAWTQAFVNILSDIRNKKNRLKI